MIEICFLNYPYAEFLFAPGCICFSCQPKVRSVILCTKFSNRCCSSTIYQLFSCRSFLIWLLILPCFLAICLIIGQDSATARWIQLLNKTKKTRWPKLSQNSRKISENYRTRENAFDKTRERFFREILGEFLDNLQKIWRQQKTLRKMI